MNRVQKTDRHASSGVQDLELAKQLLRPGSQFMDDPMMMAVAKPA
jgi:hypothetical protein